MSECLGCQRLEDESVKLVELHTGQKVCNYCPEWMLECEAKEMLAKPLKERQRTLLAYEAKSQKHVANLKQRMTEIFNRQKTVAPTSTRRHNPA